MPDTVFSFETEPFELPGEEFEARFSRGPRVQPWVPSNRGPVRSLRFRQSIPRVLVPPIVQAAESRCPTAAVLEGYSTGSASLAPHHEPTLARLVKFLQTSRSGVRNIQVIGWSADRSTIADQRLEAASARLQELLKRSSLSIAVQGSVHSTKGPERVEFRLCM